MLTLNFNLILFEDRLVWRPTDQAVDTVETSALYFQFIGLQSLRLDTSRNFLRIANNWHGHRFSVAHSPQVLDQSRELSPHVGLDDLLTALGANSCRNGFDHNQLSLKPKALIDSLFVHLVAADVASSIITR